MRGRSDQLGSDVEVLRARRSRLRSVPVSSRHRAAAADDFEHRFGQPAIDRNQAALCEVLRIAHG